MLINHTFTLDLLQPGTPPRIHVKQGDTLTHGLTILLTQGAEPWVAPAGVNPVLRWAAHDPDSGQSAQGIYDTLPSGVHAWTMAGNQLDFMTVPQMFALPGIVQADILFVLGQKTLATFNFEFYVNPAPADGKEPEVQKFYKVATLGQINSAIDALDNWKIQTNDVLAKLEKDITLLKKAVHMM